MLTTVLELLGLALLIAAAYLAAGPAAALLVAGVACLWASWSLTRAASR
jgi:hypothetical protein